MCSVKQTGHVAFHVITSKPAGHVWVEQLAAMTDIQLGSHITTLSSDYYYQCCTDGLSTVGYLTTWPNALWMRSQFFTSACLSMFCLYFRLAVGNMCIYLSIYLSLWPLGLQIPTHPNTKNVKIPTHPNTKMFKIPTHPNTKMENNNIKHKMLINQLYL
jgi:hypothetical protein